MQWLSVLPLEVIAASVTIGYWNDKLTRAIFITIFLITIILINMFGIKGYGEAEFTFSIIKITAVIGFMYDTCQALTSLPLTSSQIIRNRPQLRRHPRSRLYRRRILAQSRSFSQRLQGSLQRFRHRRIRFHRHRAGRPRRCGDSQPTQIAPQRH